jgi:acyl dehydratase
VDPAERTLDLPDQTFRVTRLDLVKYAGASGDFNPIHWNDRFAAAVGLPGVIAHGLLTMALVGRALTGWAGNPAGIVDFNVRFTRPVVVPDTDEGAELVVRAVLRQWTDEGYAVLDLTATCGTDKVLSQARATVRPS